MKMILVVLVVRAIIGMVEKNKNVTEEKNKSRNKIIHKEHLHKPNMLIIQTLKIFLIGLQK